jgi:hypothetical protein
MRSSGYTFNPKDFRAIRERKAGLNSNYGKALASFKPAGFKDIPPATGTHALEKTMFPLARNFLRLIRPLRHFNSSIKTSRSL